MSFDVPAALALLAAVPLAALLLMRRLRRRRRPVAAFFLLRDLVDALPLLPRSFLLRRRLQALLFLAALACAALAAAGPVLGRAGDPPQRAVLLLDALAPQDDAGAPDGAWRRATRAAADTARSFRGDDRILLARTDAGVVGGGLLTPRQAAALIEAQRPSALPLDLPAAADLLAVLERAHAPALVGIVTAAPARWQAAVGGHGGRWSLIAAGGGAGGPNHGLLDVEVRPDLMRAGRVALFCRVGSFGPADAGAEELTLDVSCDGRSLERRTFRLSPGESRGEAFPALDAGTGVLRVSLSPADAFPDDDVFLTPLRGRLAVPTLLVTEENAPLEAALRALPGLDVAVARPGGGGDGGAAAVRVYDAVAPAELAGNVLAIAPPGGLPGIGWRGDAPTPLVVRADATHFLLQGVALENLRPGRVPVYQVPTGMEVLATADGHPLIAAGRAPGGARLALVAFDPKETDWVYTPSYPILIANLAAWLAESPEAARSSFRVGEALPGGLARSVRRVVGPDGAGHPVPDGGWAAFRFPRAGRWRLEGADAASTGDVFVNLLDERASAAALPAAATAATTTVATPARPFRLDARAPLLAAAVVLLLLEPLVAPPLRAGRLP